MKFLSKWALALLPGLALATPALALLPAGQADLMQPGSVIVFPKFIATSPVIVDGATLPRTEIEVGVICPAGATCVEHQTIKVRFHWVCPAREGVNSNICEESDFDVFLSIDGKLAFPADGGTYFPNQPLTVTAAPCPRGYLIGWVVNFADQPIKFDGLIGNAVIRNPNLTAAGGGDSTGLSAYSALGIQADPALATGIPSGTGAGNITTGTGGSLIFDGAAGHYTEITGQFAGDVRFDKVLAGAPLPNVLSQTYITFLTLDVVSNRPNNPVFVPLSFWNESLFSVSTTNPAFEKLTSTFWQFVCWDQVNLATNRTGGIISQTTGLCGLNSSTEPGTGCINVNLTQATQTTRKGIVRTGQAIKTPDGNAPDDLDPVSGLATRPVTLLGLIETIEGTLAEKFLERKYNFNVNVIGPVVATQFVPFPAAVP